MDIWESRRAVGKKSAIMRARVAILAALERFEVIWGLRGGKLEARHACLRGLAKTQRAWRILYPSQAAEHVH